MIFQMQESHVEVLWYLHMCARQGVGLNKGEESKKKQIFFPVLEAGNTPSQSTTKLITLLPS